VGVAVQLLKSEGILLHDLKKAITVSSSKAAVKHSKATVKQQ
jgi:hypothetical protein